MNDTPRTLRYLHEDLPPHLAAAGFRADPGDHRHMTYDGPHSRVVVDFNPPGLHRKAVKVTAYDTSTGLMQWSSYFGDDTPYDAVKAFIFAARPRGEDGVLPDVDTARQFLVAAGVPLVGELIAGIRTLRNEWPGASLREYRDLYHSL